MASPTVHFSWEDGPLHDPESDEPLPEIALDADAGLADRLWAARETADAVKSADGRTRAALYRALSTLMISPSPPSASRRIMPSCSKNRA